MGVGVDSEKRLLASVLVLAAGDAAKAGCGSIDEDEVAGVEKAVGVVDETIGRRRRVGVFKSNHPLRAERAHMEPHCRRARAAVEEKRQGTILRGAAMLEVRDIKYGRLGRGIL